MAAVLTRIFPASQARLLGRHTERALNNARNAEAFQDNSVMNVSGAQAYEGAGPVRRVGSEADADEYMETQQDDSDDEVPVVDPDEDDDGTIRVRRPRRRARERPARKRRVAALKEEQDDDDDEDDEEDSISNPSPDSSEAVSNNDALWEGDSEAVEEGEAEIANPNRCIFCGEDEENDPSEDFEEYLACSACGDNAHRQCARGADSLTSNDDAQHWRCPGCVVNGVQSTRSQSTSMSRRRSSAPKMARDLLPTQKGVMKPGSHSVFSTLILDDDPMDGSRSLRKRKSSAEDHEDKMRTETRKRQRRATSEVDPLKRESVAPSDTKLESVEEASATRESEAPTAHSPRSRGTRSRPQRKSIQPLCRVVELERDSLVIAIHVGSGKLATLDSNKRKRRRRERDRARRARHVEEVQPEHVVSHYPAIQVSNYTAPFYAFHEREGDETKSKPYGGILTAEEADTSRTFPQAADRKKFEDARQKAEEEWKRKMEAASATDNPRPLQKVSGPPSKIKCINFGKYEIDTWHAAPYPEEYSRNRVLYICEFCLKYMSSDFVAWRHKLKCPAKHPPGDEIYRDGPFSFFEVDGRKNPVYCQNLCLLAKLFLGSKTLYYDVEPFLFYVMTEHDDFGEHFVGYFSKEKRPSSLNNVSCILVLPIHQRRGFGHMLIEFSYLLTKVEKKTGSPEKPLSDMGLVSYRSYWRLILCQELLNQKSALSITELSDRTGMTADDIVCALEGLRALVRDPVTRTYALRLDYPYLRQYIDNYEKKGYTKIIPGALFWVPYVMGRDNMHYENAPHLHTVAQREDIIEDLAPEEGVQSATNGTSKEVASKEEQGFGGPSASDMPTPQDETDNNMVTLPTTPFPSFEDDPTTKATSMINPPAKLSASSSLADAPHRAGSPIPTTRFEVFPPLPGTAARRRPGRPFPRGASHRGTPVRRGASTGDGSKGTPKEQTATKAASARRTRSKLAEMVNGASEDREGGGNSRGRSEEDATLAREVTAEDAELEDA